MGIPDEDLGPFWLRDYESIEVDLRGMKDYASVLADELQRNYTPHREQVNREMIVAGPQPDIRFSELVHLLDRHFESRVITTSLLTEHGNATGTFARAAVSISERHGDADGMAKARAEDVRAILLSSVPGPTSRGSTAPNGSTAPGSAPGGPSAGGPVAGADGGA